MNTTKKIFFVAALILLFIRTTYANSPSNFNNFTTDNSTSIKDDRKKDNPLIENSFWNNHESNWKKIENFNSSNYWNQKESISTIVNSTGNTVTISNKKISSKKDDSYQTSNGGNYPKSYESGEIRYKGFRFTNLNIPSNAVITDVKLSLIGYKYGNTTVNIKAEKLKEPSQYTSSNNYLSSTTRTSSSVNWSIPNLYNGIQLTSPNLKEIVQEVLDAKDGITDLSLIISSSSKWEGWNYDDGSSSYYPKINITYSTATTELKDDDIETEVNTQVIVNVFDNDNNIPTNGTITISSQPKNGTVTITDPQNTTNNPSDNIITYTPKTNFYGTDLFKYKVCDGNNSCSTANINISVNSVVDSCDALASGNLDTDGDGVSDICDLDDDNDGILDTDECPVVTPFLFKLNENNKTFTSSGKSGDIGDTMLYKNVGTSFGVSIDLKITVTANSDPQNMTVDISGFKYGSDLYPILLGGKNTKEIPSATVKFEFLKSNTDQLVNVAPSFLFKDIDHLSDGTGESLEIDNNLVSSYSLSKNPSTDLYIVDEISTNYTGASGNFLRVNSKKEESSLNSENLWLGLQLLEVNSFNINILKRTGNTGYVFESDTFSNSTTTYQLDADCSIDTDNDGIPDYLDTDSDNDGCPDATEAEKNMQTTANLSGGSNGGSSANLGTVSNKNGIPLPFGTANGLEIEGQKITSATKTFEKITINTTEFTITKNKDENATLTVDASAVKTNTFTNGVANYEDPNGTDTSSFLTFKWYKNSDPSTTLSTTSSYLAKKVNLTNKGDYTVIITGANSSCSKEVTFTLNVNDTPTASNDNLTVNEDSSKNSLNILTNDSFGSDGANSGTISIASATSSENGTIAVDNNATPTNPLDDKITYTPLADFNGSDSFTYTITDSDGDTSTATVTVNITSVNDVPTSVADAVTLNEDSTNNSINVLDNDFFGGDGANSGAISINSETSNKGGTITVDNNATPTNPLDDKIIYSPLANFNGTDTFSYNITDANGDISSAEVTVTVTSINDLPTASADTITINEDSTSNYVNVLNNDDFGGDGANSGTISLTTATSNNGGILNINNNNTPNNPSDDGILYTPVANFNGTDTFSYSITDANGDISTAQVTVTVTSVNDKPNATEDIVSVDEDSTNNDFDVLANDSFGGDGANSGAISILSETSNKEGTVAVDNNGTPNDPTDDKITYSPLANFNGTDVIKYTITDANGDTSTVKIKITVNSINDTPSAIADIITVNEDSTNNTINVLNNDSFGGDGANTGTIALSDEVSTNGGTISVNNNGTSSDPTDDSITYTPAKDFNGTDTFNYTITDKNGDTSTAETTITINSVNDTPTAVADTKSVDEDSTNNSFDVLANDSFGGDGASSNTISITSASSTENGTVSVDNNATPTNPLDDKITYTPFANFNGSDSFTYTITDADGDTSTTTVTVNVSSTNDVPNSFTDNITVNEDSANNSIDVLNNDSFGGDGANSGAISILSETSNKGGTIAVDKNATPTNPLDDKIIYSPLANFNGIDTFSYNITDANGDTSTSIVNVTVTSINDLPTATADTITVNEDSTSNYINVLNNDSFGGDGANIGAISLISATSNNDGTLTINNNNTPNNPNDDGVLYTPAENFNGTDTFSYSITDANGDISTTQVTVTVTPVNDLPSATKDAFTVNEDSSNNNFSILDNDDFGGDGHNNGSISVTSTTSTQGGTVFINDNDTSQDPTDDTIIYTPVTNFNGTDVIEYSITDANGDISTAEITITVNSINDMPNAVVDTIMVNEDSTNNQVDVLSNDSFGGDGANTGTITVSNEVSTKDGIITVNNNGTSNDPTDDYITYNPAKDFNGTDTFSYTITDKNGDTSSAEVTVTVNSVDDIPLASNDTTSVNEDSTNNTINVINNDSFGGDGPNTGTIAIISTTSAENGTIKVDNNTTPTNPLDDKITYTPFENFFGIDSFTYTITDADGDASNATVTVNVISVNDIPTSEADTATVNEDSIGNSINVTSNDNFGGDGANSGAISIIFESTSKGGTIAVDNNSTPTNPLDDKITYTPLANFNGTDTFSYSITDANGDISSSEVTVTVTSINDIPTATADTISVDEDSTTNYINVLENDNFGGDGANSGTISLVNATSNNNGTLAINNNNTPNNPSDDGVLYTPLANFNGLDTFSYSITDANGDISIAEVKVTVTSVNDLPKTTYDTVTVNEDSTNNSFDVLANDSFGGDGPNNESILITSNTTNQGGAVTIDNNDTENDPTDDKIIYTPIAGSTGSDSFEYTITDSNGDISIATVNITINASGVKYNPTAAADCFNIFVQNNLTVANGNTAGSIAAGGDLTYSENYSITSEDCGCFSVNDVNIGMLIGGKISYPETGIFTITNENQYIKIGEENNTTSWYQSPNNTYTPIRITPQDNYEANAYIQLASNSTSLDVSNSKNPVFENNIIDFDKAFQQLQTNAISMSKETNNASVLDKDYKAISNKNLPSEIVIGLNNGINYLNIAAEDLNNVLSVEFYDQPNSSRVLIINVNTSESFDWNVWEQKNLNEESNAYILYNFYNLSTLNILSSNNIQGTILAPFADINKTANKANIAGQIIGKSLNIDGGEINCDVFDAQVYSPKDANISPTTEFTSDKENDCLVDNKFTFINTSNTGENSQPTEQISYSWNFGDGTSSIFMNPSKTYSEAGIYNVKLTATNKYGSTDKTIQIEVTTTVDIDVTESNSTVDEDAGSITKEFTLNNDTDYTSYSWSLSNVGQNLNPNEKVVSFEFTEEGEYNLTLTVVNNNCSNTKIIPITITSDEVSTGNDGGLESESLGDAISIRYFKRKVRSVPTIFKKTRDIIYNKKNLQKKLVRKSSDLEMLDMFPDQLIVGDIAHVTSPTDILDFTVADEVLSVDFSLDDKTIGVVLGVKTLDQIYNHTKATCDRLRGAEILNVKTIEIDGYNFLKQAIKQRSGVIEHAISFAVGKNSTDEFYSLQTNWYVFDYLASNIVYNFQVWASEPENTEKMVKDILANLNNYKPLDQTEKQKLPKTFATKVSRVSDNLVVNLKSVEKAQNLEISINEKLNETTTELNSRYTPVNTELEQTLTLDINDGYEYDGDVKFDGEIQDAFYHADGNWGLDYDTRYTTVNEYEVTNNFDRTYNDEELPINRNIHVKAYSEHDYLSVYKSLLPGTIAADYTNYKYLSFKAKGNGVTQLVLVKSSIENWGEQYRTTVTLTEEEQTFFIPFDSFTSTTNTSNIVADDLTTISFTYVAEDAGTNHLDLKISDVKFTKENTALNVDEFIKPMKNEFLAYPNPTKGKVNCVIQSDYTTEAIVTLYDIAGKIIHKGPINLIEGKNELDFNFKAKAGIMFLKIISSEVNYGTTKIVFK